jgi:hypothetical protein
MLKRRSRWGFAVTLLLAAALGAAKEKAPTREQLETALGAGGFYDEVLARLNKVAKPKSTTAKVPLWLYDKHLIAKDRLACMELYLMPSPVSGKGAIYEIPYTGGPNDQCKAAAATKEQGAKARKTPTATFEEMSKAITKLLGKPVKEHAGTPVSAWLYEENEECMTLLVFRSPDTGTAAEVWGEPCK